MDANAYAWDRFLEFGHHIIAVGEVRLRGCTARQVADLLQATGRRLPERYLQFLLRCGSADRVRPQEQRFYNSLVKIQSDFREALQRNDDLDLLQGTEFAYLCYDSSVLDFAWFRCDGSDDPLTHFYGESIPERHLAMGPITTEILGRLRCETPDHPAFRLGDGRKVKDML